MHESIRKYSEKVRMLTLKMIRCTAVAIVDGDELKLADSGEHLRKGTEKSDRFKTPRLDSFH
jgi:hypothetical protein